MIAVAALIVVGVVVEVVVVVVILIIIIIIIIIITQIMTTTTPLLFLFPLHPSSSHSPLILLRKDRYVSVYEEEAYVDQQQSISETSGYISPEWMNDFIQILVKKTRLPRLSSSGIQGAEKAVLKSE